MKRTLTKRQMAAQRAEAVQQRTARALNSIGGIVYIDEHWDNVERTIFWSVNYFDGEGGWQSDRFYCIGFAVLEARRVATVLGAEFREC